MLSKSVYISVLVSWNFYQTKNQTTEARVTLKSCWAGKLGFKSSYPSSLNFIHC